MPATILADSFVQLTPVRGWRFIDLAGKVMNEYDSVFPKKAVDATGLKMSGGNEPMVELQVSADRIWLHASNPGTLRLVTDLAYKHFEFVARTLEVTNFKRFGIRTQWLLPMSSAEEAKGSIANWALSDRVLALSETDRMANVELSWKKEGATVTLRLTAGEKLAAAPAYVPDSLVLIDIDVSRDDEAGNLVWPDFRRFSRLWERLAAETSTQAATAMEGYQ